MYIQRDEAADSSVVEAIMTELVGVSEGSDILTG